MSIPQRQPGNVPRRSVVAGLMVTTDGVYEGEDEWSLHFASTEFSRAISSLILAGDSLLVGRKTFQMLQSEFADAAGVTADLMQRLPKFVVTTSLDAPLWANSTIIRPQDLRGAVEALKQLPGANINITGSGQLVHSLIDLDLLDELHLFVFPVEWGAPSRYVFSLDGERNLPLVETETLPEGVLRFKYARPRDRVLSPVEGRDQEPSAGLHWPE